MANRHLAVGYDKNYRCLKDKQVCSFDNKTCRRKCYKKRNPNHYIQQNPKNIERTIHSNEDVINDVYGYKEPTADERLAQRSVVSGKKEKRAIDGAVRATRDQFQCHFTDELNEHYQRRWWDESEYPADETNWWDQLDHFSTNYDSY